MEENPITLIDIAKMISTIIMAYIGIGIFVATARYAHSADDDEIIGSIAIWPFYVIWSAIEVVRMTLIIVVVGLATSSILAFEYIRNKVRELVEKKNRNGKQQL